MKHQIQKIKATLIITLANLLIITSLFAQSPEKMSYQAVVRDASNQLVTGTTVGMQISILQGASDGTAVYVETQTPNTNTNGLATVEIGGGTVVSGVFASIDWSAGPYFIKTETDPAGGTSYTITGTSQLLSVPYALHAKTAETFTGTITETDPVYNAWSKDYNDLTNTPNIIDSVTTVLDTTTQFVRTEVDGSVTNEIQTINRTGLVVTLSKGGGSYQDSIYVQNLSSVLEHGENAENRKIVNLSSASIGTDNPNVNAALEIKSTNKGFLPPRMSNMDILSIISPTEGLMVYSLDEHKPYVFNGSVWITFSGADVIPTPATHYIGEYYGGGVVFYVDGSEYHGLICTVSDQATGVTWGCFGTEITGADGLDIGDGQQNTNDILAGCSDTGTAAYICNNLVLNGYDDWFLPSRGDLIQMKNNRVAIKTTAINNGGADFVNNVNYWSSSENDSNSAWNLDFNSSYGSGFKSNHQYVRAVRAF